MKVHLSINFSKVFKHPRPAFNREFAMEYDDWWLSQNRLVFVVIGCDKLVNGLLEVILQISKITLFL